MPPVVDSHLHIWSDDTSLYPRDPTPYPGSVELLLDYMEEAAVDHAVIVLPRYYGYDNRILADTLRRYPGKFAGIGVVDPRGQEAADTFARLVEVDGIRGVRLRGIIEREWFCVPETEPLWRRAASLNAPICLLASPDQVGLIRRMVERFADTPVVIDHFAQILASGGVDSEPFRTFLSLSNLPRVCIKLSGLHYWGDGRYPYPAAGPNLRAALDAFGPARVMWGSDWPHVLFACGYVRCLNFVRRELKWLSESEKAQILGGTAFRVWWGG